MEFRIRPFSLFDVEPLRLLRNDVIRQTPFIYENDLWEVHHARAWYDELIRENRIAITAECSGQFVGCCYSSFFRKVSASKGLAELSIYVSKEHRRRGVAQALIAAIETLLIEQNNFGMVAIIDCENVPAIRLFEEQYFQRVGVIERAALLRGEWRAATLMHKLISFK